MTSQSQSGNTLSENYVLRLPGAERPSSTTTLLEVLIPSLILIGALPFVTNSMFGLRCLIAGALFILFFAIRRSYLMPILALIYLATLGGVRRNLIPIMGNFHIDPLLVVIPLLLSLLFLGKLFRRQIPFDNPIAKMRLLLLGFMLTFGLLNPHQGGVLVALGGGMFLIVPIFWSFVGRDMGSRQTVRILLGVAAIVAAFGAVYGIYQTLYGFTPGELTWLQSDPNYTSANAGAAIRPMSFFTSAAEYPTFLALATVSAVAFALGGRWYTLLLTPLLLVGMLYSGVRSPLAMSLAGIAILFAVRGRSPKLWIPRLALAACLGIAGLFYGLKTAQTATANTPAADLVAHQVEGITNPTDPTKSTAPIHAAAALYGVTASLTKPIGIGLGSVTLAGYQLGKVELGRSISTNMEIDWSNLFLALGPLGGIVYLVFIGVTIWCAFKVWHHARTLASLLVLGALVTTINGWLNSDNYAVAMLVWFSIGALEREYLLIKSQHTHPPATS